MSLPRLVNQAQLPALLRITCDDTAVHEPIPTTNIGFRRASNVSVS